MFGRRTLTVDVEEDTIFVRPPISITDLANEDPEIRGTVRLSLPVERAVTSIRVELNSLCDAYGTLHPCPKTRAPYLTVCYRWEWLAV